jgi:hypothetical protein
MSGMTPKLYRENFIILMVLQALFGTLSPNLKALTLEFGDNNDIVAHFLLRQESDADREEIEENFPTEVSVMTNGIELGDGTELGEVLAVPVIEFVADHEPGYVPPGRRILKFRD